MNINFTPQRSDDVLTVIKQGDTLTINDTPFDFSVIPDGATLPSSAVDCEFITGDISRIAGVLSLTILLPHGANPTHEQAFPASLINPSNGVIV